MNSPRNPKIRGLARAESGPNWTLRQDVSEGLVQDQRLAMPADAQVGRCAARPSSFTSEERNLALHQRRQAEPVAEYPSGG